MDDEPDRLSNRLLEYDPNTNKWKELSPMKYSKYRCSAVVLNGEIFVMGNIIFLCIHFDDPAAKLSRVDSCHWLF